MLAEAARDPYVALIEGMPAPLGEAAGRAWIERKRAFRADGRGWELAIVDDGAVVGGTGLGFRHPSGIRVLERERGRGARRARGAACARTCTSTGSCQATCARDLAF